MAARAGALTLGLAVLATAAGVYVSTALLIPRMAAAADVGEESGEITGGDAEKPKSNQPYSLQATDPDAPKDPAKVAAKKAADAEAAKQAALQKDAGPPFYTRWQFWAIAGVVLVALGGAIYGGSKLVHAANGGDVSCPYGSDRCFGQGAE